MKSFQEYKLQKLELNYVKFNEACYVTLIRREIYILLRNLLTTNQRRIGCRWKEDKYIISRRFPEVSKSEYSCRLYFEACG